MSSQPHTPSSDDIMSQTPLQCPSCHGSLRFEAGNYRCTACHKLFTETVRCRDCQQPVNMVTGCGSTHYLCPTHALLSTKQCIFTYHEI